MGSDEIDGQTDIKESLVAEEQAAIYPNTAASIDEGLDENSSSSSPLEEMISKQDGGLQSGSNTTTGYGAPSAELEDDPYKLQSLDEFLVLFKKRYNEGKVYKKIVHNFMKLSKGDRTKLWFAKRLRKNWYEEQVDDMIEHYATDVYESMIKANKLQKDRAELEEAIRLLEERGEDLREATSKRVDQEARLNQTKSVRDSEVIIVEDQTRAQILEAEREKATVVEAVQVQPKAREIAKEQLKGYLANTGLVQFDSDGGMQYAEERIVEKLEDMMLSDVIDGMESEGNTGFLAKVKDEYDAVVSHYERIVDFSKMSEVDWLRTIRQAAINGRRTPDYRDFMVPEYEESSESYGRLSVNSAIVLDRSGSMKDNQRMQMAERMALSLNALMRKLNPENVTNFAIYNNVLQEVKAKDIARGIYADGGTETNLALDWIIEQLAGHGPGIGHLVTDGEPNSLERAVYAARKFQEHPLLMLRIYLIDGDRNTESYVREMGKAAGPNTKVIPLKGYRLPGGALMEVPDALSEIYSIMDF